MPRRRSNTMGPMEQRSTLPLELAPGIGEAMSARELAKAIRSGDKMGGAVAAMGMIPVAGKGLSKIGAAALDAKVVNRANALFDQFRSWLPGMQQQRLADLAQSEPEVAEVLQQMLKQDSRL